ncbi:tetratricopeptide repeat protein, partial [Cyanobium sp. BA20m-p-22]|nr:tetratricopeptide repeat protein [Cyanobium sp. BA20m-p-22]
MKQLDAEVERLYEAGNYAEATAIAERSLAWKEVKLGPEHPDTAASLNNLAFLYDSQGL